MPKTQSNPLRVPFPVSDEVDILDVHPDGHSVNVQVTFTFTARSIISAVAISNAVRSALLKEAGTVHVPALPVEDSTDD